jgi:hypothetical protein
MFCYKHTGSALLGRNILVICSLESAEDICVPSFFFVHFLQNFFSTDLYQRDILQFLIPTNIEFVNKIFLLLLALFLNFEFTKRLKKGKPFFL